MTTIQFYSARGSHGCFSNFSRHAVVLGGKRWPTSEHYFQAMKFPHDPERQERIRKAANPFEAKKLAWEKGVRIRKGWDNARDQVMLEVLRAKFTQHAALQETLLETGDALLVEHTTNDSYWGDGGDGSGQNKLGKLLMKVREELRNAQAEQTPGPEGQAQTPTHAPT